MCMCMWVTLLGNSVIITLCRYRTWVIQIIKFQLTKMWVITIGYWMDKAMTLNIYNVYFSEHSMLKIKRWRVLLFSFQLLRSPHIYIYIDVYWICKYVGPLSFASLQFLQFSKSTYLPLNLYGIKYYKTKWWLVPLLGTNLQIYCVSI